MIYNGKSYENGWLSGKSLSGWWYTSPSEKYESQMGWLFPIYGKIKNHVPNHQPEMGDVWIGLFQETSI